MRRIITIPYLGCVYEVHLADRVIVHISKTMEDSGITKQIRGVEDLPSQLQDLVFDRVLKENEDL